MAPPRAEGTIRLKDGRRLGYAEYGDPRGKPLFFFHGFPNARLGPGMGSEEPERRGIRVIALERPGFGLSDFKAGRKITDWPDDVVEVADAFGIDRFAILAGSGGGPYAAACAAKIPERLTSVALVSALGPLTERSARSGYPLTTRIMLQFARFAPWFVSLMLFIMSFFVRYAPNALMRAAARSLPDCDAAIMNRPDVLPVIKADIAEAFRQGSRAASYEMQLFLRPWGFRLENIAVPVHLWQGEADETVPISMGRYLEKTIPNCNARFYPGEGHLLAIDRMDEIQDALFPESAAA